MNRDDKTDSTSSAGSDKQREAAANIIRGQLDGLYDPESTPASEESIVLEPQATEAPAPDPVETPTVQPVAKNPDIGPYERTYVERPPEVKKQEWDQYQSAWQDYYQKYYEKYYTHHYEAAQKIIKRQKVGIVASRQAYQQSQLKKKDSATEAKVETKTKTKTITPQPTKNSRPANYFEQNQSAAAKKTQLISEKEATKRLRNKIQARFTKSATKVRRSRHFMPLMAASAAVFIFLFLQFNQLVISNVVAYVSPGNIDPQNIVIDTPETIDVDPVARLIIPKINVDVPVHYDIGNDTKSQNTAMRDGLAHFSIPGASSHPGEIGNTVIAGHSSGDLFMNSEYKFIFAQLHKLEEGDKIYAHYNGKRYTYAITTKEVVYPEEVNKLIYDTAGKPVMTLITCTPLGTALQRLLVTAEQISPDPLKATAAAINAVDSGEIPGNEPTWIEKVLSNMFGSGHN